MTIAALFVETNGVYFCDGVDPWDVRRDARKYRGPHPVIAHPPCQRWGRYWSGGPSARKRLLRGDDEGCFAHALWCVRTFGGVVEHPEASSAWEWFGLPRPAKHGEWTNRDRWGGASCCVEQGHYGHRARKATWLYLVSQTEPPALVWGRSNGERLDEGFHSSLERAAARAAGMKPRASFNEGKSSHADTVSRPADFFSPKRKKLRNETPGDGGGEARRALEVPSLWARGAGRSGGRKVDVCLPRQNTSTTCCV